MRPTTVYHRPTVHEELTVDFFFWDDFLFEVDIVFENPTKLSQFYEDIFVPKFVPETFFFGGDLKNEHHIVLW